MDSRIKKISAREILDSRGFPTVEVEVEVGGEKVVASVPSGTSTGKYEALELRDGGERYQGRGVLQAVKNINEIISPALLGKDVSLQREIDQSLIVLDGTENKSKLGANAICAVSLACCRAAAILQKKPLWKWISQIAKTKPQLPFPCLLYVPAVCHYSP